MKRFFIAFFIFFIWFCIGSWIYTCKIKALCTENKNDRNTVTTRVPVKNTLPVSAEDTAVSAVPEQAVVKAKDSIVTEETDTLSHHKVLYFGFDSEKHKTDQALKAYITALKTYLNTHPGKKISITGHTDSVGEAADNEWIGMQRAKSAMKYLVTQGIPEDRIVLRSKGEAEPIAPNTTKDGRRRNRRVEIMIN